MTLLVESTELRAVTSELKRLSEFCRSAAVKAGVFWDGVASAVSVDRLNEYLNMRLLLRLSWSSIREDQSASRNGADADVFWIWSEAKSREPVWIAAFWSRYSTEENHQARSFWNGPPTDPPYCSRSNGGVGKLRLKVEGNACRLRFRSKRNAEP